MEINSVEFNENSKKYIVQKSISNLVFSVLFGLLVIASIVVAVLLFTNKVDSVGSYILIFVLILAGTFYTLNCLYVVLDNKKILNKIEKEGSFVVKLKAPIKLNFEKKLTPLTLVYLVCAILVFMILVASIVFVSLTFSFEILCDILFMLLILFFATLITVNNILDDTRIKINYITSQFANDKE